MGSTVRSVTLTIGVSPSHDHSFLLY
jgi:hypothetical protein